MNRIYNRLLYHLTTDKYITASQLGEMVLLNEKTVRRYIKNLNIFLVSYGATIESKHGYGFRLIVNDEKRFSMIFQKKYRLNFIFEKRPETVEDRCEYILACLMKSNEFVNINDLLDYLCISDYTLQSDIKHIKSILEAYQLKVVTKNNEKIKIYGSEFNKRLFIVNYPNRYLNIELADDLINKQDISSIVLQVLDEYNISMSEISINNIILHLYTAIIRIKNGNSLKFEETDYENFANNNNLSQTVSKKICTLLSNKYNVEFDKDEQISVAIHFFGHRVTEKYGIGNLNVVISQEIYDLVTEILQFIYITMKVDLRKNLSLLMNLAVHMLSLEVRLKYHIRLKNPLLLDIKKNYAFGYTLAAQAAIYIENAYNQKHDEDEIGYLALIFAISTREKEENTKNNILIVCATGKASAELLSFQYREVFEKYLDKIFICNVNDLPKQKFNNIDYILTTTDINIAVPVPILRVKLFLTDEDEKLLRNKFKHRHKNEITKYFKKELFVENLKADNKNEAIIKLCDLIQNKIELPDNFVQSVLRREEFGATDFGHIVALAHPYGVVTSSTFASVAVLDKPIFWGNHNIQIIILISLSENDINLESFFNFTSMFMLDRIKPKKLINDPTYENLIDLLND